MTGKSMGKILVTGASGQIGSELTPRLRSLYGKENVVASDIREPSPSLFEAGPYEILDVTKKGLLKDLIKNYNIDTIFHLAALLSATGEQNPQLAWSVNISGLYNVLELSREFELTRVFHPSSIAAFGPETPRDMTPQMTILRPKTIYGVTKVTGELLGEYYFYKYGVDIRGIRFPGVISNVALPGGGTTDYAVEIFYHAIKHGHYDCFVKENTVLPMIYMPDCLKSAINLMEAPLENLKHHTDYNIAGMSFSAGDLASEIIKHLPKFTISYKPDYRQAIADTWPKTIDDKFAREEWNWEPDFDLSLMTEDMLQKLSIRLKERK